MFEVKRIKPVNRHLLIVPHVQKNETNTGVLLPEDYKPEQNKYIEATVIDVADDCARHFKFLGYGKIDSAEKKIVIDRSMIEEVSLADTTHYMILENYVVGVYRRTNEG